MQTPVYRPRENERGCRPERNQATALIHSDLHINRGKLRLRADASAIRCANAMVPAATNVRRGVICWQEQAMTRRDSGPMDVWTAAGIVLILLVSYSAWLTSIVFCASNGDRRMGAVQVVREPAQERPFAPAPDVGHL
jgi:hypothetical protein